MRERVVVQSACLLLLSVAFAAAEMHQSVAIAVVPFRGTDVDTSLLRAAEERAKEIIAHEGPFDLVPALDIEERLSGLRASSLERDQFQLLMKELGASMIVESSMAKRDGDRIDIQIRISARSSTWRPPTVLSATASNPNYAIPQTERLVRQFINRYFDESSMERFFQSALVPGLGQYREGYRSKAWLFFFGTTGLFLGSVLLPDGDPYVGSGTVEARPSAGGSPRWFIGDTPVSPEEAQIEIERRAEAEDSRDRAHRNKLLVIGAGIAVYAANLYDILKITRRYDRVPGGHLSFEITPLRPKRLVSIECSFNL